MMVRAGVRHVDISPERNTSLPGEGLRALGREQAVVAGRARGSGVTPKQKQGLLREALPIVVFILVVILVFPVGVGVVLAMQGHLAVALDVMSKLVLLQLLLVVGGLAALLGVPLALAWICIWIKDWWRGWRAGSAKD
jgi:hypothetical protein